MSLRFKGSDLRPVLAEAVANQCRVVLAKDQGVYFLAEQGERRPDGRVKLAFAKDRRRRDLLGFLPRFGKPVALLVRQRQPPVRKH